jgi:hypothetical protein
MPIELTFLKFDLVTADFAYVRWLGYAGVRLVKTTR